LPQVENGLLMLLGVPFAIRDNMSYIHDGAAPHFSLTGRELLGHVPCPMGRGPMRGSTARLVGFH